MTAQAFLEAGLIGLPGLHAAQNVFNIDEELAQIQSLSKMAFIVKALTCKAEIVPMDSVKVLANNS